jgi:hypothetical protein
MSVVSAVKRRNTCRRSPPDSPDYFHQKLPCINSHFLALVVPPLLLFFFLPAASTFSDRPTFFQPGGVGAKRKQKASAAFQKQSRAEMQPSLFKYNRLKRSAAI